MDNITPPCSDQKDQAQQSKSIFLIEDNPHERYFFTNALRDIKNASLYDTAANGKEALEKLRSAEVLPDMIITDINMPVMDGIQCLTEIVKAPKLKDIPVVVLSSDISKREIVKNIGAKAFIAKPGDYSQLCAHLDLIINTALDSQRNRDLSDSITIF